MCLTHVLTYFMQKHKCLGRSSTLFVWLKQTLPACFAVSDCNVHPDHLPVNNFNQGFMTCSIALDTYLRMVWCSKPPLHSKNLSQLVIQFIAKLWTIISCCFVWCWNGLDPLWEIVTNRQTSIFSRWANRTNEINPIMYHGDFTGIGWSSGTPQVSFLFIRWQTSHVRIYKIWPCGYNSDYYRFNIWVKSSIA